MALRDIVRFGDLVKSFAPKTREAYMQGFRKFVEALNLSNEESAYLMLKDAGADRALARFIVHLNGQGLAPKTILLYLSGVKLWLDANGIGYNPALLRKVAPRKKYVKHLKAFRREDVVKILKNSPPKWRLLFWFYAVTGARRNEALAVRTKDFVFDADPPYVIIRGSKTEAAQRIVPLPNDFAAELKEHLKGRKPDDYVFSPDPARQANHKVVDKAFRRLLKRVGMLERDESGRGYSYSLNSFRRFYHTTLVNAGVSPLHAAKLVGHDTGVESHYFKPEMAELAREWRKAEDALTFTAESPKTARRIQELEERLRELEERYRRHEMARLEAEEDAIIRAALLGRISGEDADAMLSGIRARLRELNAKNTTPNTHPDDV